MSDPQRSLTQSNPVPTTPDAPFLCEDCGHQCIDSFCSRCGQARVPPPKTLLGILGDFVGQYFNLEGKLWRTLALLLHKPGVLTQEYFAGRRTRYFTPVRLYLTLSLLFFTVASFTTPALITVGAKSNKKVEKAQRALEKAEAALKLAEDEEETEDAKQDIAEARQALQALVASSSQPTKPQANLDRDMWWLPGVEQVFNKLSKGVNDPRELERIQKQFRAALMGQSPRVLFLLLPVFAAIFKLVFRKRCYYSEAFVFTLHLHCVVFIAVLLAIWVPGELLMLATVAHGLMAMKRVFGQTWFKTSVKALLVFALYTVVLTSVASWLAYRVVLDL